MSRGLGYFATRSSRVLSHECLEEKEPTVSTPDALDNTPDSLDVATAAMRDRLDSIWLGTAVWG
jgi:hypothetical protein